MKRWLASPAGLRQMRRPHGKAWLSTVRCCCPPHPRPLPQAAVKAADNPTSGGGVVYFPGEPQTEKRKLGVWPHGGRLRAQRCRCLLLKCAPAC